MQKTLQLSFLMPQTARAVASHMLKDPATVQDMSYFTGKAVGTSVTRSDAQTKSALPIKQAPPSTPHSGSIPSPHAESLSNRQRRHGKEKKQ